MARSERLLALEAVANGDERVYSPVGDVWLSGILGCLWEALLELDECVFRLADGVVHPCIELGVLIERRRHCFAAVLGVFDVLVSPSDNLLEGVKVELAYLDDLPNSLSRHDDTLDHGHDEFRAGHVGRRREGRGGEGGGCQLSYGAQRIFELRNGVDEFARRVSVWRRV